MHELRPSDDRPLTGAKPVTFHAHRDQMGPGTGASNGTPRCSRRERHKDEANRDLQPAAWIFIQPFFRPYVPRNSIDRDARGDSGSALSQIVATVPGKKEAFFRRSAQNSATSPPLPLSPERGIFPIGACLADSSRRADLPPMVRKD